MRHAPATFADMLREKSIADSIDVVFCSDMLNLAELRGMAPALVAKPTIAYFHENQYTYPVRVADERDLHFGFTNLMTALTADAVWFNSQYHCNVFLQAADSALRRMPDFASRTWVESVREKSSIHPPGIEVAPPRGVRKPGPLRILWAARWEHDKGPETFFQVIRQLKNSNCEFRLSVLGESFRSTPACFAAAEREFAQHIDHWGFCKSRDDYWQALLQADVFVSTAQHEFFGIAAAEALAAGCYALLPDRLAYPELVQGCGEFLYQQEELHGRLKSMCENPENIWRGDKNRASCLMQKYQWPQRVLEMDAAISGMMKARQI